MILERESRHIIRTVVDTIQQCNLRCGYCHPGITWEESVLQADKIGEVFKTSETRGVLEVTLTGGEITLHPELTQILEQTHILDRTVATLITNGTLLTPQLIKEFKNSNIGRFCISLDGIYAEDHNFGRGITFNDALKGLYLLQATGKSITVISVAHHHNYKRIISLSQFLAENHLATQHHICAPSYSGSARKNYDKFRLRENEFFELQQMVDDVFEDLNKQGLYVTFNSFWPATGERSNVNKSRTITLVQLTEQLKDCYVIIRPNGDIRLTSAAWGRETVGNAVVGNLNSESADVCFERAEDAYAKGRVKQLPREVEAIHKFHYGIGTNPQLTDQILDNKQRGQYLVEMIPIRPLSESDLFAINLSNQDIINLANLIRDDPKRYRIINVANNSYILFDRISAHVTLLTPKEAEEINTLIDSP